MTRAIQARNFGDATVLDLVHLPTPTPASGEVVISVAAADTLFLDVAVRRGDAGPWAVTPPYVPGSGIAGRVSVVGPGVHAAWVGRRVVAKPGAAPDSAATTVGAVAASSTPTGGYAEEVRADVRGLVPVPDALDLETAAAMCNDGMTAALLADAMPAHHGERVLVMPAAGGAGNLLIQLARSAGARVIAAGRGPEKLASARDSGADEALDYSTPDWTRALRAATGGRGIDLVLDGVGGKLGRAALEQVARGGRFLAFGAPGGAFSELDQDLITAGEITARLLPGLPCTYADEQRQRARALTAAAEDHLRPVIGLRLPLDRAAEAHRAIEAREVVGKTLLVTDAAGNAVAAGSDDGDADT